MTEGTIARKGEWLSASVGNELVMMSADTGKYISLSRVARRIWELIERPRGVDSICQQLATEFKVSPEICRTDVEKFLNEMIAEDAIETLPSSSNA